MSRRVEESYRRVPYHLRLTGVTRGWLQFFTREQHVSAGRMFEWFIHLIERDDKLRKKVIEENQK
jgi:hypothetical protein